MHHEDTPWIVSYLFSTSNHNSTPSLMACAILSHISFLHQTTTVRSCTVRLFYCLISLFYIKPQRGGHWSPRPEDCLISLFYIKPQQAGRDWCQHSIVSYLFSTSNHNLSSDWRWRYRLSHISFLHQTTTVWVCYYNLFHCLISLFYIKPQLFGSCTTTKYDCLISLFYIKPQLIDGCSTSPNNCLISLFYIKPQQHVPGGFWNRIVSYLFSTSNHNWNGR